MLITQPELEYQTKIETVSGFTKPLYKSSDFPGHGRAPCRGVKSQGRLDDPEEQGLKRGMKASRPRLTAETGREVRQLNPTAQPAGDSGFHELGWVAGAEPQRSVPPCACPRETLAAGRSRPCSRFHVPTCQEPTAILPAVNSCSQRQDLASLPWRCWRIVCEVSCSTGEGPASSEGHEGLGEPCSYPEMGRGEDKHCGTSQGSWSSPEASCSLDRQDHCCALHCCFEPPWILVSRSPGPLMWRAGGPSPGPPHQADGATGAATSGAA